MRVGYTRTESALEASIAMRHRPRPGPILAVALLGALLAGCGPQGVPGALPDATVLPRASSFDDYAVAFCTAWDAMFRAVGNPDTGAGSDLSKALDAAVEAKDGLAAERIGEEIRTELEDGRRAALSGVGWAPATKTMEELDRVFVAFEKMTAAKVAVANEDPDAIDPQLVLEQAGGMEAWAAMFEAYHAIGADRPADVQPCEGLPISP